MEFLIYYSLFFFYCILLQNFIFSKIDELGVMISRTDKLTAISAQRCAFLVIFSIVFLVINIFVIKYSKENIEGIFSIVLQFKLLLALVIVTLPIIIF